MKRHVALALIITLLSLSSSAFAQDSQSPGPGRGACRADAEKLCAGIEHGHGRIRSCLAGQKDKLSDDCRKWIESRGN
jgi:hypothetical protein